ncbi:arsenate reductase/protein-tyrosine-phosphatase family protein [Geodermatophilus maliterrae]|uniref:Phosphotyrosine protein phosphatase I domain-containing protein n=1 Tax=Geodermatophilus maliterrae TaxID=3162531 RepID=A0ABV3XMW0_9ACTN
MTVSGEPTPATAFRLLFVCTGNICRSAAAERLARRRLAELLLGSAAPVQVHSAGTRAVVGAAIHPDSAAAVRALGGDVDGFAARRLRRPMVTEADLVLTMTREHRQAVLGLEPRALSRTFTLREAADLARLVGELPGTAGTPAGDPRSLVGRMAAARRLRASGAGDDVDDPIAGPPEAHARAVASIAECLGPVLEHVLRPSSRQHG